MKKLFSLLFVAFLIFPSISFAAVTFMEPGGDADFQVKTTATDGLWDSIPTFASPSAVTDHVHGSHLRSIQYRGFNNDAVGTTGTVSDAGARISQYVYIATKPSATVPFFEVLSSGGTIILQIKMTSAGVLQLFNNSTQIGSSGSTLSTGTWYRLELAYTITSTSVNSITLFKDGVADITITNATLGSTGTNKTLLGNISTDVNLNFRSSDHYIDNSNSMTDTGDVWVTAKRPVSNGTTNGFTTQVGSGGSGYGSGHTPQVNERALSTTNGWSMIGAGSAVTEEYTIEGQSVGDIDVSAKTIVDSEAWVSASSLTSETAQIISKGASSNISLTSTNQVFRKISNSAVYPAGGTDVGIITSTTLTTVQLNEAGMMIAYLPATVTATPDFGLLSFFGDW